MKKYLLEGIGTFALAAVSVLAVQNGSEHVAPLIYGLILAALIFAGGRISGAHFNPAVSLAHLLCGKLERWDVPYYALAQAAGGLLAAVIAAFLLRCQATTEVNMRIFDPFCALFAEALGAFILCFVYLLTANPKAPEGSNNPALAAGFSVAAAAYALRNLSEATFNPAIALGLAITGIISWTDVWICLAGAFLGAAAAASVFRAVYDQAE